MPSRAVRLTFPSLRPQLAPLGVSPAPESAITTRPNHPLPSQDFHLRAGRRLEAAHRDLLFTRPPVLTAARVKENWLSGLAKHAAILLERDLGCQPAILAYHRSFAGRLLRCGAQNVECRACDGATWPKQVLTFYTVHRSRSVSRGALRPSW